MGTQGTGEGSEQMLTECIGGGLLRRVSTGPVITVVTTSHTKALTMRDAVLISLVSQWQGLLWGREERKYLRVMLLPWVSCPDGWSWRSRP